MPVPEFAWYDALFDTRDEAHARHAADQVSANQGAALPFADGAFNDSRFNGHN